MTQSMDDKTLTALRASIVHWEENVAAETPEDASPYAKACPLCTIYWPTGSVANCGACPVSNEVDKIGCGGTPWGKAAKAYDKWEDVPEVLEYHTEWRLAAQAELDFLRSLLPEGEE